MNEKQYISGLVAGCILSLGAFLIIISLLSPGNASWMIWLFFYVSLLVFLCTLLAIIGHFIKKLLVKKVTKKFPDLLLYHSFILSLAIVTVLFLQANGLFRWWSILIAVIIYLYLGLIVLPQKK